eukprot:1520337-Pyramimonas_sp.AAC.1
MNVMDAVDVRGPRGFAESQHAHLAFQDPMQKPAFTVQCSSLRCVRGNLRDPRTKGKPRNQQRQHKSPKSMTCRGWRWCSCILLIVIGVV